MTRKAIVIGTGIGGSAIAALLASRGFSVSIYEKNGFIGGRCCSHERDGFIIDMGVHTFSQSGAGPLGAVLRKCGKDDGAMLKWGYTRNPTQKLYYLGRKIEYPKNIEQLGVSPDEYMAVIQTIMSMSPEEIRGLESVSVFEWLREKTQDPVIHNVFAYISQLYFIVNYWRASAGEFIRSMQEQARSRASGYPIGGCRQIPNAYLDVVRQKGGAVHLKQGVKRILMENNRAVGVELEDGGTAQADIVISNVDPQITVRKLAGERAFPDDYVRRVNSLEYTHGAYVLKFALDRVITQEKFIMVISHPDPRSYYTQLENDRVPDTVNLMMPIISNLDPGTAPEGKQLIIAGSFPAIKPDWNAWRRAVMNTVKGVFPDIEQHIRFVEDTTVDHVNALMGEGGGVIGLAQTIHQAGEKRLKQIMPVENLYLVGAEAGGWGIGTELAANSALELNEMIV